MHAARRAAIAVAVVALVAACGSTERGTAEPAGPTGATSRSATSSAVPTPATSAARPTPPAAGPTSRPSQAAVTQSLSGLVGGDGTAVVDLGSSYEAMAYDQRGGVSFWSYGTSWSNVGTSSYPYDSSVGDASTTGEGAVLPGMSHATFILEGSFSGDGTAGAIGFTDGPNGWGVIKALPNGDLASSGQGVAFGGVGLENDAYFVGGRYETAECSATLPFAACGGDTRVLKFWAWDGSEFALSGTAGLPR